MGEVSNQKCSVHSVPLTLTLKTDTSAWGYTKHDSHGYAWRTVYRRQRGHQAWSNVLDNAMHTTCRRLSVHDDLKALECSLRFQSPWVFTTICKPLSVHHDLKALECSPPTIHRHPSVHSTRSTSAWMYIAHEPQSFKCIGYFTFLCPSNLSKYSKSITLHTSL